ncbi:KIF-binding protein [Centruroides vittatus]|uniref:KIF-binding protein n=1 Tax=Centruroides vittatus TaxID=120091 RepID=UPI00350EA7BF
MSLEADSLDKVKEKYTEIRRLLDEECKNDPPSHPYKSKYEARKLLQELDSDLNINKINDADLTVLLLSLINYDLGIIAIDTDEIFEGEECFKKCLEYIKDNDCSPKYCILCMKALNQLGILWSGRNELKKACEYLKKAENIYKQYLAENPSVIPIDAVQLFLNNSNNEQGSVIFEKVYTHTLYYLAQVYKNLEENETAALYCFNTLQRQLETDDYDPIEWSLNSATLSQYYFASDNLSASRHFLACAEYILSIFEKKVESKGEKNEEQWDKIKHCKASIARCWINYGLFIFTISEQEVLLRAAKKDGDNFKEENEKRHLSDPINEDQYVLIDSPEVKKIEQNITNQYILNFEKARIVFHSVQNWLKVAKDYFTLDGHTTDYVQLTQDSSRLYKLLAFFESNADRQCKMHKRRIDLLEEILQQLNPQFYLLICRQLMFELAETYSEIMDIKLSIMKNDESRQSSSHAIKKVNALIFKAVHYFEKFIDTLKENNKLPEKFAEDVVRPALVAHFCIGRLYSKLFAEPQKQLENIMITEKYYKYVINYIKKHPSQENSIKEELPLIKEMVELIPGKIKTISRGSLVL